MTNPRECVLAWAAFAQALDSAWRVGYQRGYDAGIVASTVASEPTEVLAASPQQIIEEIVDDLASLPVRPSVPQPLDTKEDTRVDTTDG